MKSAIKKAEVIILKGMDYRETSRIITAFSQEFGKITLLAKGVRSPKSRMSASLQSLVNSEVIFYKKETTEMYLVKEAETIQFFKSIHDDLTRYNYATVVTDFLLNLVAVEQISKTLYQYSLFTLNQIDRRSKRELPLILLKFLIKGSSLLGFRIEINKCANCGKTEISNPYFSNAKGGILCDSCRNNDYEAKKISINAHNFMKKSQEQKEVESNFKIKLDCLKEIFNLLSKWFIYHNNTALKTLDKYIKVKDNAKENSYSTNA
jgi:DNA repair protein RecO (recombination protein O)